MARSTGSDPLPRVAFLGLGAMGLCMSTHLYRSGFPLTGYDIYPPTLGKFEAQCKTIASESNISLPVKTASSPAAAVSEAEVIVLMVATHYHVESALFEKEVGAIHGIPKNAAIIIAATVPPTYPLSVRKKLGEEFNRSDIALLDCPVSGGTARAVDGTLTIMASSDSPTSIERADVKTVLDALAGNLNIILGGLGAGTSAKALNQVCCGIHITASSEIMGLAAVLGLDTETFYAYQIAQDGEYKRKGWSWMFENRGARMLQRQPPMASATAIIVKDVGIIVDETKRLSIDLPMVQASAAELKTVMDAGMSTADDSCVVKVYLEKAGQTPDLVVERAGSATMSVQDEKKLIEKLSDAHAAIHTVSAYETMVFAEALKMTSPEQRKQWYTIISGAAGGSTMFYTAVPMMMQVENYQVGMTEVVKGLDMAAVTEMSALAEGKGYSAPLLKLAVETLAKFAY